MDSREASVRAPTATGIGLLHELRAALLSGGKDEDAYSRAERMYALFERRKDEVTMTLLLMMAPGDPVAYLLNNALLGGRWNSDMQRDEWGVAPPLHPQIHLKSLRTKCSQCEGNKCGRKGKYHDITYRAGTKSGTGAELNMITAMGGSADINVLCAVDPDTGEFSLPPMEAKMALREWGEYAVRATRRWVDKANHKGDRWKVRELRHHELYANANLAGSLLHSDVPAMPAD
jgi:hypothetical protein